MVKLENPRNFLEKTRKFPLKILKTCRGRDPGLSQQRDFPKFSMTGGFSADTPRTHLILTIEVLSSRSSTFVVIKGSLSIYKNKNVIFAHISQKK